MEDLSKELRSFLQAHPSLQLTDSKKIKCTLNDHEFPCSLTELQHFISGKKYKQLWTEAQFDYSQYEPHVVTSTKQPNHLFCKLTLRHINRLPQHVLRHVNGKRYKKALEKYEECVRQGVEFVPASLKQKKRTKERDDVTGGDSRGKKKKEDSGIWDPSSSEAEKSDSEDSMSDLYPPSLFTVKTEENEESMKEAEQDDFKTDDDEMEVDNHMQKRKKVQPAAFNKKFKKNKKRKGFRRVEKVNGK